MNRLVKLFKLVKGRTRSMFSSKKYGIKSGYTIRKKNEHHDDTDYTDEYQMEVYQIAKRLMKENNLSRVVDFGCGSGYKLLNILGDFDTVGVEISPTINFLREKYPHKNWIEANTPEINSLSCDLIISSDVIEHVPDPDSFLTAIQKIKGYKYFVVSTPDRDIVGGWSDYGPPVNNCHVREWNGREFVEYVSRFFTVISHQITHYSHGTQMLICVPKNN